MSHLSLIVRLHPRPSLFPYTTLFRSQNGFTLMLATRFATSGRGSEYSRARSGHWDLASPRAVRSPATQVSQLQDRKSTRLNSSHVAISYAVFCWKKKTVHEHAACPLG